MLKVIIAGLGAHGRATWCDRVLPKLAQEGIIRLVGAVDPNRDARAAAAQSLNLEDHQLFADLEEALASSKADIFLDATLPELRLPLSHRALQQGLHLYLEKPVGMDLGEATTILDAVRQSGRKAAVNMSAAFHRDKLSLEHHLRTGSCGSPDYLFVRFSWNGTEATPHRKATPHSYLREGGVHALEMIRRLAGSNARTVCCHSWTPPWTGFREGARVNLFIEMENGIRAQMEGGWGVAATINTWGNEYLRIDGDRGSLVLDRQQVTHVVDEEPHRPVHTELDLITGDAWAHEHLFRQFCEWVEGRRDDHPTDLADNIHCMALLFAAIESADRGGKPVDVPEFLAEASSRQS